MFPPFDVQLMAQFSSFLKSHTNRMDVLTRFFQRAMDAVVTPCLVEGEPYAEHSRKLAVIFFAAICANALFLGGPLAVIVGVYDPNLMSYLLGASFVAVSITSSFIPYIYLRVTRTIPQWMVDFQVWSTVPGITLAGLSVHQGPVSFILSCILVTAVLLRVRLWNVYCVFVTCCCLINQLVVSYSSELPELKAALFREQLLAERLIILVGFLVAPAFFMAVAMYRLMADFVQRADQADAAIAMNLAVADKLRRYDTDGVAEILAAHAGRVDEKLLTAFANIQHNLQEYRPHIPDYIIASTTSDDGDDDETHIPLSPMSNSSEGDIDTRGGSLPSSLCIKDMSRSQNAYQLFHRPRDDPLSEGSLSHSIMSMGASYNNAGVGGGLHVLHFPTTDLNDNSVLIMRTMPTSLNNACHSGRRESPRESSSSAGSTINTRVGSVRKERAICGSSGPVTMASSHYSGGATTVYIRFLVPSCQKAYTAKGNRDTIIAALSYCVESAARHAKAHHGALQYMQGCGLMVSFNAASRLSSHESKACSFVLALRDDMEQFQGPTLLMHATVVTSSILSFFAGNKGQLMLTVLGDFMNQHTAMHQYLAQTLGDDHTCILVSERSASTTETFFIFRSLGAVAPRDANALRNLHQSVENGFMRVAESPAPHQRELLTMMIELVSKRKEGVAQEWMYELAKQDDGDPFAPVKRAVDAAIRGHIVDDFHKLGWVERTGVASDGSVSPHEELLPTSDAVLERCVKSRLARCVEAPSDFVVRTASINMW